MLSSIRRYLSEHRTAGLADIARHVDAEPDAVRGMLDHWATKGKVCRIPTSCGGCTQCDPATIETYRWLDEARGGGPGRDRPGPLVY